MESLISLDASTTEIGYTIWDKSNGEMLEINHLTLPNEKKLIEKLDYFSEHINQLKDKFNINEMVIEQSYEAMFGGNSRTEVTTMLNQINFGFQYVCHIKGITPHSISVSDCRKYAYPGIKFGKDKETQKKTVLNLFIKEKSISLLPKKIVNRKTKNNNKGDEILENFAYDMVDSYVVGKAFFNLKNLGISPEKLQELKKETKKLKKKKTKI